MTEDVKDLKGKELYEEVYDIMNLKVGSQTLVSRVELNALAGKKESRVYQQYIPWLKKEHPGTYENVQSILEYNRQT